MNRLWPLLNILEESLSILIISSPSKIILLAMVTGSEMVFMASQTQHMRDTAETESSGALLLQ